MKARIKNYLSVTKKEWNGMVVMLGLIALVLAAPYAFRLLPKDSTINISEFNAALARLNKADPGSASQISGRTGNTALFKFNPNSLAGDGWEKLGLSEKQIGIIKNYKAKGGRFYKPGDLKKIYGITPADYARLQAYIDIPVFTNTGKAARVFEINSADSATLTKVHGIGPSFARRIIYYRDRLGGFITKEQLKEVYGLDEIKYKEITSQLKVDRTHIRKININTITFDKLRLMPYLDYKQVNALIEYRKQHGSYTSIADLKNIAIMNDVILRKIEPYLIF